MRIFCRWDGEYLYDTNERSDRCSYHRFRKPNCSIEYRNFFEQLRKAEKSEYEFVRIVAKIIRKRVSEGVAPSKQKALLRLVLKKKTPKKLVMVVK